MIGKARTIDDVYLGRGGSSNSYTGVKSAATPQEPANLDSTKIISSECLIGGYQHIPLSQLTGELSTNWLLTSAEGMLEPGPVGDAPSLTLELKQGERRLTIQCKVAAWTFII